VIRNRLIYWTDRLLSALFVAVLLGGVLAFGGMVWWARPALGAVVVLLAIAWLVRVALGGTWKLVASPLGALGALALLLSLVQLAPLPAALAKRLSPRAQALYAIGFVPEKAHADDPDRALPPTLEVVRSPATLDRASTLRWLVGALGCLTLFAVASQFVDRLGHGLVIWGSVVASFLITTVIGFVQWVGGSGGLYGLFKPGSAPWFAPTTLDLLHAPVATALRPVGEGVEIWAFPVPDPAFHLGGLVGGPGAYLALASLALPLTLGALLQLLAPRGGREPLMARLRESGRGALAALLFTLLLLSAGMVGCLAGPWLACAFAVGLLLAGLPVLIGSGIGRLALAITTATLVALGGGVALRPVAGPLEGSSPITLDAGWPVAKDAWLDAARVARDFPLVGAGLGSFPAVGASYKTEDRTTPLAQSALSRWSAETGLAGLALLGLGLAWCLVRLPAAVRRVGSADRALSGGLFGSVACFALVSALHWTVEIAAVALAASAVLGTWDRWLAGATDLFVEPT
jgi:hypothetical protein